MTGQQLRISRVGWRSCLTDLGRRDTELLGVPSGGTADRYSAVTANLLAGNPRDAVLVETIGGLSLRSTGPLLVAVTGAPATVTIAGAPAAQWTPLLVPAGQELAIGAGRDALRSYLAIGGELDAVRLLGSAAPDPRMGFRQEIAAGAPLTLHRPSPLARLPWREPGGFRFGVRPFHPPADGCWTLRLVPAAEHGAVAGIRELLADSAYSVTPDSDHVGVRVSGPVAHPDATEIVSHGVPVGAVEIPHADDELILLGRYRTVTAGYPIVGVVARVDLDLIGQLLPGHTVRFRWIDRKAAVALAAEQETALSTLERATRGAYHAVARPFPLSSDDKERSC